MASSSGELITVDVTPATHTQPPEPSRMIQDTIYVAVGDYLKHSESTLKWALKNSGGRKICIIHVHRPSDKIPIMGTKFRVSQLQEHLVGAYHETERENMLQLLGKYCAICQRIGVRISKEHIEMDSIEEGIVELIIQHGITKLVMGAAADKLYSRKMMEPKSKKAIYVLQQAPVSCHIWFVCKGNLIYARQGVSNGALNVGVASPRPSLQLISRETVTGQADSSRSRTPAGLEDDYGRVMSDNNSRSSGSGQSTCSSSEMFEDSTLISYAITDGGGIELENRSPCPCREEKGFHSFFR